MEQYKTLKECQWQLEQRNITTSEKLYWKNQEYKTMQRIHELERNIDNILDHQPSPKLKAVFNDGILRANAQIQKLTGF